MKGIYKIVIEDYYYIGSSKNLNKRKATHLSQLKNNCHHNIVLQRIFNKYDSKIKFEIIQIVNDDENLKEIEQSFLNFHHQNEKCLNIGSLATGGDNLSNNPNKEIIKQKISNTLKEKYALLSEEEKKIKFGLKGELNGNWKGGKNKCKCGNKLSYTTHGEKCIKCIDKSGKNNNFYNKKHSIETKKNISEKAILRLKTKRPNNIRKIKIEEKIFESLTEAAIAMCVCNATIIFRIKSKNFNYEYFID